MLSAVWSVRRKLAASVPLAPVEFRAIAVALLKRAVLILSFPEPGFAMAVEVASNLHSPSVVAVEGPIKTLPDEAPTKRCFESVAQPGSPSARAGMADSKPR